jgi:hypothetical protein
MKTYSISLAIKTNKSKPCYDSASLLLEWLLSRTETIEMLARMWRKRILIHCW